MATHTVTGRLDAAGSTAPSGVLFAVAFPLAASSSLSSGSAVFLAGSASLVGEGAAAGVAQVTPATPAAVVAEVVGLVEAAASTVGLVPAGAPLRGDGSLVASLTGGGGRFGSASLEAEGTAAAVGDLAAAAEATLVATVVGLLDVAGDVGGSRSGAAILVGEGSLSAVPAQTTHAAATLEGLGAALAAAEVEVALDGGAVATVVGLLDAVAGVGGLDEGRALLRGDGSLVASLVGGGDRFGSASLEAEGTAAAVGEVAAADDATLSATIVGRLLTDANVPGVREGEGLVRFVGEVIAKASVLARGGFVAEGRGALLALSDLAPVGTAGAVSTIVGRLLTDGDVPGVREGEALVRFVGEVIAKASTLARGGFVAEGRGALLALSDLAPVGQVHAGAAALTGVGALAASATIANLDGEVFLFAVGGLAANATNGLRAASHLPGAGRLEVDGSTTSPTAAAAVLAATGTFAPAASNAKAAAALLAAQGGIDAAAEVFTLWRRAAAVLRGLGALSAQAQGTLDASSALAAVGNLTANAAGSVDVTLAAAALTGRGDLSATSRPIPRSAAALTGRGALAASARSFGVKAAAAVLRGVGDADALGGHVLEQWALLFGQGLVWARGRVEPSEPGTSTGTRVCPHGSRGGVCAPCSRPVVHPQAHGVHLTSTACATATVKAACATATVEASPPRTAVGVATSRPSISVNRSRSKVVPSG